MNSYYIQPKLKEMIKAITPITVLFLFISCSSPENTGAQEEVIEKSKTAEFDAEELTTQYCGSCHGWTKASDKRIAPVLKDIQFSYNEAYADREERMRRLVSFISKPATEKAIMQESVALYGLMPSMPVATPQLMAISEFIMEADFDAIESASEEKLSIDEEKRALIEKGKNLALSTKAVLGKNLIGKLEESGAEGALAFCNLKAIHLTDSMSQLSGAKISRVSDQNRNPENEAKGAALEFIKESKVLLSKGQKIQPKVSTENERAIGFYPILTNAMCLQCHGKKNEEIKASTFAAINKLYPEDKAIGYGLNELRGIWVVEWPLQEE